MNFNTREDIEAPIDFVFEQITDFATFERSIMRRGGDVDRLAIGEADGLDAQWRVKFQMRGVERDVTATITIATKILFKSIRFAKQKSEGRFKAVVAGFAADIEKRYRA